jgi:GNAT superfamily N-acetyltransferase
VAELWRSYEISLGLPPESTEAEVREWWVGVDLERDSWLIEEDGRLVAFAWIHRHDDCSSGFGAVAPERRDLFPRLLDLCETATRTAALPRARFDVSAADETVRTLLESRGYRPVRRFYEMVIDLEEPPSPPKWAEGLSVAPFRPDDARAFYDAVVEAFADSWGGVSRPFDEWRRLRVDEADTSLYFVAWDGDDVAGVLRGMSEFRGMGYVAMLGVRPAWQGRGVGEALLRHAFGEFHRRGERRVGLGVDSENSSATRLYERAGMRVALEHVVYERELA